MPSTFRKSVSTALPSTRTTTPAATKARPRTTRHTVASGSRATQTAATRTGRPKGSGLISDDAGGHARPRPRQDPRLGAQVAQERVPDGPCRRLLVRPLYVVGRKRPRDAIGHHDQAAR